MTIGFGSAERATCGCGLPRRRFLQGLGAAASAGIGDVAYSATRRNVIDVHTHYLPPVLKGRGGSPVMDGWSLSKHLEDMQRAGVARSVLSITTPGVMAPLREAKGLIRAVNEYGARIRDDHRKQLGLFTYVRLDDVDGALAEIAYGLDVLKTNGVGLFTSYGGKYIGDPAFDAVFEELDRRGATVYVHPTSGACCAGVLPYMLDAVIEYGTDTTRAIANYVYRGAARRFAGVKMIWSHSGGTMPYLIERFDGQDATGQFKTAAPDGFRAQIAKFFFDVAQASNPVATDALRKVVPPSQIVFGTDYPFRTLQDHVVQLESGGVFTRAELQNVYHGNVERALPALLS